MLQASLSKNSLRSSSRVSARVGLADLRRILSPEISQEKFEGH